MLPVVAANIRGPNGLYKRGNVLLDSGAQISLIRSETADSLGLKGRDISVNLIKVGGEEESIHTKIYKVPVSGIGDPKKHSVRAIVFHVLARKLKVFKPTLSLINLAYQKIK
jgi:hypothetical protein